MKLVLLTTALCAGLLAGCEETTSDGTRTSRPTTTTPSTSPSTTPSTAPDNTARNERDRTGTTKTPTDQGNSAQDIEAAAQIRRSITDDAAMSTNARNVKIMVANGVVTLRGVVDSQDEKQKIEDIARRTTGVTRVDNELEVKGG